MWSGSRQGFQTFVSIERKLARLKYEVTTSGELLDHFLSADIGDAGALLGSAIKRCTLESSSMPQSPLPPR